VEICFLVFAYLVLFEGCGDQLNRYVTRGGWTLAIVVATFSAITAHRELGLREWWRIREREEATEEHIKAKRSIAQLIPAPEGEWLHCQNRYEYVWRKWKDLSGEGNKDEELDQARRKLSHFWVDVAELVMRGILTPDEVWRAVGDPELIFVLEPLEVFKAWEIKKVKAKQLEPWPWGAAKALGWWLGENKDKKIKKVAKEWKHGRIPVEFEECQKLFTDLQKSNPDTGDSTGDS